MTRRTAHIILHWTVFMLILVILKGGTMADGVQWAFVIAVTFWAGLALAKGLIGRAGPKLPPAVRRAYPWMHRAIYIALVAAAALHFGDLLGYGTELAAWNATLGLLCLGAFHGLFQFWRHNALFDGALRLITPRFMHHIL